MANKVILIGNLGKDPEIKEFEGGNSKTTFSLATSERWTNKDGEKQEKTTWHNIIAWGRTAEIMAEYLSKGSKIYIEGKIDNRSYEVDGDKKYISEVVVDKFEFISSNTDQETDQKRATEHDVLKSTVVDNSLPF